MWLQLQKLLLVLIWSCRGYLDEKPRTRPILAFPWVFLTMVVYAGFPCSIVQLYNNIARCNLIDTKYRQMALRSVPSMRATQPDGTLFFLIFTYLWAISHGSFRNYGSNAAICIFFEPEINRGEFRLYFELFEKSCRGRHHSDISKPNAKTLIFSIWILPQGSQGCQKMRQDSLNMPFEV